MTVATDRVTESPAYLTVGAKRYRKPFGCRGFYLTDADGEVLAECGFNDEASLLATTLNRCYPVFEPSQN